jgi:UDP-2,3-diacylglucosamine hydrolase
MSKSFFLSDVHLAGEKPEKEIIKEKKLLEFLEMVRHEGSKLFILGDFFDFWFDYKTVIFSKYFKILNKLRELIEHGVEIHFFGGNHDWWVSQNGFLAKEIGMIIHPEPEFINIDSNKFFIAHGDGLAKSDWGYRSILRPILRSNFFMTLFSIFPAEWAFSIATMISSGSKLYTENRDLDFENEYKEYAEKMIDKGADYVIIGHLHIIMDEYLDAGRYINIGDFYKLFTYGEYHNNTFSIKRFVTGDNENGK